MKTLCKAINLRTRKHTLPLPAPCNRLTGSCKCPHGCGRGRSFPQSTSVKLKVQFLIEAHQLILLVHMVWFWNPFWPPLYCIHANVLWRNFVQVFHFCGQHCLCRTTQSAGSALIQASSIYTQWWESSWAFKLNSPSLLNLSSNNNLSVIFIVHWWTCSNMSMLAQNWTQHSPHDLTSAEQREGSTPLGCWHHSASCRPMHPK